MIVSRTGSFLTGMIGCKRGERDRVLNEMGVHFGEGVGSMHEGSSVWVDKNMTGAVQQPKEPYLCNLAECTTFLSEIDDNSTTTLLCLFYGFLNTENKVWTTSTNVRTKNIRSVTLQSSQLNSNFEWVKHVLTSSWTLNAKRTLSSDIFAGSPKQ